MLTEWGLKGSNVLRNQTFFAWSFAGLYQPSKTIRRWNHVLSRIGTCLVGTGTNCSFVFSWCRCGIFSEKQRSGQNGYAFSFCFSTNPWFFQVLISESPIPGLMKPKPITAGLRNAVQLLLFFRRFSAKGDWVVKTTDLPKRWLLCRIGRCCGRIVLWKNSLISGIHWWLQELFWP